jgi:hypothetical protein
LTKSEIALVKKDYALLKQAGLRRKPGLLWHKRSGRGGYREAAPTC